MLPGADSRSGRKANWTAAVGVRLAVRCALGDEEAFKMGRKQVPWGAHMGHRERGGRSEPGPGRPSYSLNDSFRVAYHRDYLAAVKRAMVEDARMSGYSLVVVGQCGVGRPAR